MSLKTISLEDRGRSREIIFDPATHTFDARTGEVIPRVPTLQEQLKALTLRVAVLEKTVEELKALLSQPS